MSTEARRQLVDNEKARRALIEEARGHVRRIVALLANFEKRMADVDCEEIAICASALTRCRDEYQQRAAEYLTLRAEA